MTRVDFDRKLREMQDEILAMSSMVEKAIQRSVEALRNHDAALSNSVVADDALINAKRYTIEEQAIHTIALQQPMAADLRVLIAILFIASELERMADHAEGIGRINIMLEAEGVPRTVPPEIFDMATRASDMLRRSVTAFIDRDASLARQICDEDDAIDTLYDRA